MDCLVMIIDYITSLRFHLIDVLYISHLGQEHSVLSVSASKSMTHNSDSTLNLCLLFNLKFVCHVVSYKMPTHLSTLAVVLKHAYFHYN